MKWRFVIPVLVMGMLLGNVHVSKFNPLSEDSNGNGIPDILEGHVLVYSFVVPAVATCTITALIFYVAFASEHVLKEGRDYRGNIDLIVKVFKSKYREVIV